jgi:DNA-directed RNA polymerase specialized sigma subunit
MEDVTELIAKASQELGPEATDEEISQKVLESIEALPQADRAQLLDQLVKGVSSGQLRHLGREANPEHHPDGAESAPHTETTP